MENRLIERFSLFICNRINKYGKKEGLDYVRLKLGAEIAVINISKWMIMLGMSAIFKTLPQTCVMMLTFAFLRRFAFGLHARNSTVCTVVSLLMFMVTPKLLEICGTSFNAIVVFSLFCLVNLILYKYAPADTEARPIIGTRFRKELKRKAVICGLMLMCIALLIGNNAIATYITLAALFEAITILPVTYRLLKRRINNYEEFEG